MCSRTCWKVRTSAFGRYVYLSSGQSCAIATSRLPMSFQLASMASLGVRCFWGAPSWAFTEDASMALVSSTSKNNEPRAVFINKLLRELSRPQDRDSLCALTPICNQTEPGVNERRPEFRGDIRGLVAFNAK